MALLQDKVALITGGSRGIGASIVSRFAQAGAQVAFTYHSSKEKADALAQAVAAEYGVTVKAYQSDAASFSAAEELAKQVLEDFGTIDVLVNNAGITRDNLILRMNEEQWDQVMDNNLKSVFNLTKQVVRPMMKSRAGSIINVSSIVGITGNAGQSNYAASKAGIIGFSKSIAKELGSRNVRCNVIAPGFIATDMTDELDEKTRDAYLSNIPLRRFGEGTEIADACVFLASDMSSYISGQVLSVCGALNC
ncbi:3-oxoacyl-[acyl-carrier-protein] reductase [Lewinella cohaerens]|uniref:3-oxoacyl-[acyl-carrier-protein] reductase n=1 Tax=Lewinella cohaerens TaxID=70995 RepID=UPI000364B3E7|nr:3-oxoacyl-[acyl-carrier-protein] reductase [Lewinella cohaerens]